MEQIVKTRSKAKHLINHETVKLLRNGSHTTQISQEVIPLRQTLIGYKNPAWKGQIQSHTQAATPLEAWYDRLESVQGYIAERRVWTNPQPSNIVLIQTQGNFPVQSINDADVSSISLAQANNLALTALTKKIADAHTEFSGGTFIGELGEAVRMIKSPAKSLRKGMLRYLDAVKKRIPKRSRRSDANRIVADTWLEYSFGWIPLTNDIGDAIDVVNRLGLLPYKDLTLRAVGKQSTTIVGSSSQTIGASAPFLLGIRNIETEGKVRYIAGVRIDRSNYSGWKRLGLAPSDFLPTAWNLLPFSFLVDYFTNVGDVITACANAKLRPRWVVKTTHQTYRRITKPTGYTIGKSGAYWTASLIAQQQGNLLHERVKVTREPYNGPLIPTLDITIPGAGLKWINMGALLTSMLSGRKTINSRLK